MKVIVKDKNSPNSELIALSAETNTSIVCASHMRAEELLEEADKLNLNIPGPIPFTSNEIYAKKQVIVTDVEELLLFLLKCNKISGICIET